MSKKLPKCPSCGATGQKCKRPSGHESMAEWHSEREDLMAEICGCDEVCKPWLAKRGKSPIPSSAQPYQPDTQAHTGGEQE